MLYSYFHFFASEGGGGAKNGLNARPSLLQNVSLSNPFLLNLKIIFVILFLKKHLLLTNHKGDEAETLHTYL